MEATVSVDEFQALEDKVLRAVEMIRREREARAEAEAELAAARTERDAERATTASEIAELKARLETAEAARGEVDALQRERENVRQRVEKMLAQMDELG